MSSYPPPIHRRQFVRGAAGVGLALVGAPLLSACSSKRSVPRITYLSSDTMLTSPSFTGISASTLRDAFQQGLHDLGYEDGRTIAVDYHFEPDAQQLQQIARDTVRAGVNVVVAADVPAMQLARQATRTIPIVTAFLNDPLATGAVSSLARPGGNVTGPTVVALGLNAKQLQILKTTVPSMARIGVVWNTTLPDQSQEYQEMVDAAPGLGLQIVPMGVRNLADFPATFAAGLVAQIDGFAAILDALTVNAVVQFVDFERQQRLPGICAGRGWPAAGGLMAYGTDITDLYRRASGYVDRILRGARPAEMPVERPTRFALWVNTTAARELGIAIPDSILVQATEVIQ